MILLIVADRGWRLGVVPRWCSSYTPYHAYELRAVAGFEATYHSWKGCSTGCKVFGFLEFTHAVRCCRLPNLKLYDPKRNNLDSS